MRDLFPDSASVQDGELAVGGVPVSSLAEEFGTPLVVYCRESLQARARAYREAAPGARILYSVKAFPNLALLRLFADEGLGAEVSALGELEFALRAGIPGDRIVVDGNNKSDEEIRGAAAAGASFVVDAPDDLARARAAGIRGDVLVRVTPGIDAETHDAIRTGHTGSKFGLPPDEALEVIRQGGVTGLHVHIGSQLLDFGAESMTVEWLAAFAARCRAEAGWTPRLVDLGGGLGIRYLADDSRLEIGDFVHALVASTQDAWRLHELPEPELILEPGRSLVGDAALTVYRVGVVKPLRGTTYVAVDGGMSDNPRPQLYGARFTAALAGRFDEPADGSYTVCGKHCESGDVLIERVALPKPRRGDLLVLPSTGAYTLGMASNYNGVPKPAAVLVGDGDARLIRRRETVEDLLALESG
jgi:diaminopimelate decarboxylase